MSGDSSADKSESKIPLDVHNVHLNGIIYTVEAVDVAEAVKKAKELKAKKDKGGDK